MGWGDPNRKIMEISADWRGTVEPPGTENPWEGAVKLEILFVGSMDLFLNHSLSVLKVLLKYSTALSHAHRDM